MDEMKALARLIEEVCRMKARPDEQTHKASVAVIINKLKLIDAHPPNSPS